MTRRRLATSLLAVPVLVWVYLRAALRPAPVMRLGAVVATLAIGGAMGLSLGDATPTQARAPGGSTGATVGSEAFRPVVLPAVPDGWAATPEGDGVVAGERTVPDAPADRAGEAALAAAALPPPSVIRFRPRAGSSDVEAPLEVSVRFSQPMDVASSTEAFSIQVDGTAWTGRTRWAEARTVLVVRLPKRLPAGAEVRLSVSEAARSIVGRSLVAPVEATFTVAEPPPPAPRPTAAPRPAAPPRSTTTPTPSSTGWAWPLIGPITQRFGESLTQYGYHQGIDIDGDTGDPVRAARAGRVILAGYGDSCGGIQVQLDHGGGLQTWYRHLSAASVAAGQRVEVGQVVGRVGNTGCSLGSHLHFAVRVDGSFVDPLRYLPRR